MLAWVTEIRKTALVNAILVALQLLLVTLPNNLGSIRLTALVLPSVLWGLILSVGWPITFIAFFTGLYLFETPRISRPWRGAIIGLVAVSLLGTLYGWFVPGTAAWPRGWSLFMQGTLVFIYIGRIATVLFLISCTRAQPPGSGQPAPQWWQWSALGVAIISAYSIFTAFNGNLLLASTYSRAALQGAPLPPLQAMLIANAAQTALTVGLMLAALSMFLSIRRGRIAA